MVTFLSLDSFAAENIQKSESWPMSKKAFIGSSLATIFFHINYLHHRNAMLEETWHGETWLSSKQAEKALKARMARTVFALSTAGLGLLSHKRSKKTGNTQSPAVWKN